MAAFRNKTGDTARFELYVGIPSGVRWVVGLPSEVNISNCGHLTNPPVLKIQLNGVSNCLMAKPHERPISAYVLP